MKKLTNEQTYMKNLINEFNAYVVESVRLDHHAKYDDHMEFLKEQFQEWQALKEVERG